MSAPNIRQFHTLDLARVAEQLNVTPTSGLSHTQAAARRQQFSANELTERDVKSPWAILWEQLTGKLVLILIGTAIISALVGDYKDMFAILAIVVLNAVLGVVQEYRAERAMAALKKLAVPLVKVRRENTVHEIAASELVPGDVILLEAGNMIPADARVIESVNLRVQEAILTGESEPIEKETRALGDANAPLGDRRNMVFMGTAATYGRGQAIVTATGMQTELGQVAAMIQGVQETATPMQKRLDQLGQRLGIAALALVVIVFGVGVLIGEDVRLMFMTAISMAVALVPEGLPAVVTITLALGAQRMLKRNALIRKLPAVETLGSVTVICSDKTGTLTENRMTVTILDVAGHRVELTEEIRRDTPILKRPAHHGERRASDSALACRRRVVQRCDSQTDRLWRVQHRR